MINYREIEIPAYKSYERESITCDKCKETHTHEGYAWGNFHQIRFTGGYGSQFGDMDCIECDLCDKCCFELIGPYVRYNPNEPSDEQE